MRRVFLAASAASAVLMFGWLASAGDLNPPAGPVAPTHKTLTQVEPRTPIGPMTTPGDADSTFRISAPGSYYLTGNLTGEVGKHGIEIASNNVSIDLNGFALVGIGGSLSGVFTDTDGRHNHSIVNGAVSNWGGSGVVMGNNAVVRNIRVFSVGGNGIDVDSSSAVTECVVENPISRGIKTREVCVVSRCAVNGAIAAGIDLGADSVVNDCAVSGGNGTGILLGAGCTATANSSSRNLGHGIEATGWCLVESNQCRQNGNGAVGAGIHTRGAQNRIVGNACNANPIGIECVSGFNHLSGNTVHENADNYLITGALANQHQIDILLFELPETIDFACNAKLASTLTHTDPATVGLTIAASDVSIDLNGFSIVGPASGTADLVASSGAVRNIEIRNGELRFAGGDGIDLLSSSFALIEGVRVVGQLSPSGAGFRLGADSTIRNSAAVSCAGDGISTADRGKIEGCSALSNGDVGVIVGADGVAQGCTVQDNTGTGISLGNRSRAIGNHASRNGVASVSTLAGIEAPTGVSSGVIEGNTLIGNDVGISVGGTGWTIVRNIAKANPLGNYSIGAGNHTGTITANPAGSGANDNLSN